MKKPGSRRIRRIMRSPPLRFDSLAASTASGVTSPRSRQGLADSFFQYRGNRARPRRLPSPLTRASPARTRFAIIARSNSRRDRAYA